MNGFIPQIKNQEDKLQHIQRAMLEADAEDFKILSGQFKTIKTVRKRFVTLHEKHIIQRDTLTLF